MRKAMFSYLVKQTFLVKLKFSEVNMRYSEANHISELSMDAFMIISCGER